MFKPSKSQRRTESKMKKAAAFLRLIEKDSPNVKSPEVHHDRKTLLKREKLGTSGDDEPLEKKIKSEDNRDGDVCSQSTRKIAEDDKVRNSPGDKCNSQKTNCGATTGSVNIKIEKQSSSYSSNQEISGNTRQFSVETDKSSPDEEKRLKAKQGKTTPEDVKGASVKEEKRTPEEEKLYWQKKKEMTEDELKKLKALLKEKQTQSMAKPKIFTTLDELTRDFPSNMDKDEVKKLPPLYMSDIQHLILFALQGNFASFKPRWCRLLRVGKVPKVVVMVMDCVSSEEFQRGYFPTLRTAFDVSVDVISPCYYGNTVQDDLFHVPISVSQMKKLSVKSKKSEKSKKVVDFVVPVAVEQDLGSEISTADQDAFCRTCLLLSTAQMIKEGYPMPIIDKIDTYKDYMYTKDAYAQVTSRSPMFAVDCEMCQTERKQLELTRISVVNERLETVYDTLVKPHSRITDYLTRWSGITKGLLENVTTRLKDVQGDLRRLLPANAILCGQSLNGDLNAMEMFHPYVIDTSVIYNLSGIRRKKTGLRALTAHFLGRSIQEGSQGHSSLEDATATMELVLLKLKNSISYGDLIAGGLVSLTTEPSPGYKYKYQRNISNTEGTKCNDMEHKDPQSDDAEHRNSQSDDVVHRRHEVDHKSSEPGNSPDKTAESVVKKQKGMGDKSEDIVDDEKQNKQFEDLRSNQGCDKDDEDKSDEETKRSCDSSVEPMDISDEESSSTLDAKFDHGKQPKRRKLFENSDTSLSTDSHKGLDMCIVNTDRQKTLEKYRELVERYSNIRTDVQKRKLFFQREGEFATQDFFKVIKDSSKSGAVIDEESSLSLIESVHTQKVMSTSDKISKRLARETVKERDCTFVQLHGYRELLKSDGEIDDEERRKCLWKLDRKMWKVLKTTPASSVFIVVLPGKEDATDMANAMAFVKIT